MLLPKACHIRPTHHQEDAEPLRLCHISRHVLLRQQRRLRTQAGCLRLLGARYTCEHGMRAQWVPPERPHLLHELLLLLCCRLLALFLGRLSSLGGLAVEAATAARHERSSSGSSCARCLACCDAHSAADARALVLLHACHCRHALQPQSANSQRGGLQAWRCEAQPAGGLVAQRLPQLLLQRRRQRVDARQRHTAAQQLPQRRQRAACNNRRHRARRPVGCWQRRPPGAPGARCCWPARQPPHLACPPAPAPRAPRHAARPSRAGLASNPGRASFLRRHAPPATLRPGGGSQRPTWQEAASFGTAQRLPRAAPRHSRFRAAAALPAGLGPCWSGAATLMSAAGGGGAW